jgi:hypothetical protein
METERKATPRQLAYIQQLRRRQGKESIELDEDLSAQEASKMIESLMGIPAKNGQLQHSRLNDARLGMVLKECFRDFRHDEKDILKEHRQRFKETVIKTYQLFTEIARELEQSSQMEA